MLYFGRESLIHVMVKSISGRYEIVTQPVIPDILAQLRAPVKEKCIHFKLDIV